MLARLIQHAGFADVMLVGGAGDHGADVLGTMGRQRWVLQSKFHTSVGAGTEGPREAVQAMASYEADVAVAATNQHFTEEAIRFHLEERRNGVTVWLWNGSYLLKFYNSLGDASKALAALRPYQAAAVSSVEDHRSAGAAAALVIMATGLGKTVVASELIRRELTRNVDQEVLVLAHTVELVRQLEQASWPQLHKQHATHLWTDGEAPAFRGGVVFATWQTVEAARRRENLAGRFGLVVVDEAHHAPSDAYRRLLIELSPSFLLGLTATPWRGDERDLGDIFGPPAFTMDLIDGMQQGYLAEVDYRMLTDGIDWEDVARRSREGYTVRELNALLLMPDRDVAMVGVIASKLAAIDRGRAIGFCRTIEHARRLQPLLAAQGVRAALLHSELTREERFRNLSGFRRGDISMLLSVEMLNEGIDVPDVNVVAFMRVTHSRRIFVQQLGRGLRLSPGKGKVLVLDFVADVRRVAAAFRMNRDAGARGANPEVMRFRDGRIIKFDNDHPASFFSEYLEDVADVENLDDGARLRFPDAGRRPNAEGGHGVLGGPER